MRDPEGFAEHVYSVRPTLLGKPSGHSAARFGFWSAAIHRRFLRGQETFARCVSSCAPRRARSNRPGVAITNRKARKAVMNRRTPRPEPRESASGLARSGLLRDGPLSDGRGSGLDGPHRTAFTRSVGMPSRDEVWPRQTRRRHTAFCRQTARASPVFTRRNPPPIVVDILRRFRSTFIASEVPATGGRPPCSARHFGYGPGHYTVNAPGLSCPGVGPPERQSPSGLGVIGLWPPRGQPNRCLPGRHREDRLPLWRYDF